MPELTSSMQDELRDLARRDFYFFAKGVLGFDWMTSTVHLPLCRELEKKPTELLVILPRGWLKTTVCSLAYPVWLAVQNPNVRCLLTQNTYRNACAKLKTLDGVFFKNPMFKLLFPDLVPTASCTWSEHSKCVPRNGAYAEATFEAAGTRTQMTSTHWDLIVEDDTVAPDLEDLTEMNVVPTKEDISQAIGWHSLVPPLLNDILKSQNFVVCTRWFEKDLASWIMANQRTFRVIQRAVRERDGVPDESGPAMYPERFGEEALAKILSRSGPYLFSCLYMNKPMASVDMAFKKDWFEFYETVPGDLVTWTTVDLAGDPEISKGTDGDYNVVVTCGRSLRQGIVYVLDYWRRRANPGEVVVEIFNQVKKFHPLKVWVESVAYQGTLQYWIRERQKVENVWFLVEGVPHRKGSKTQKISALQPFFMQHRIRIRRWMIELMSELEAFPIGAHDDIIDCLSMQIPLWDIAMMTDEAVDEERRAQDPLTLDHAIKELRGRAKSTLGRTSPLRDIFETTRNDSLGFNLSWAGDEERLCLRN
jgi:predicted phage terminase large subunit-like protein